MLTIDAAIAYASGNLLVLIGGLLVAVLIYWFVDERDARSRGEQIDNVGDRAENAVGGVLSGTRALLLAIVGILGTTAAELTQLSADLNSLLAALPLLLGHLAYGLLSLFGVELGLERKQIGMSFIVLTIVAVVWAASYKKRTESYS